MKKEIIKINKLFDLLDDWRNLPGYQLERRADIFFAIYLDKIIERKFGAKIDLVIPEFPIRKDNLPNHSRFNKKPLKKPNQSFQIDYLLYSKSDIPQVFLVELKTDKNSRNEKQDWYLEEASKIKVKGLVEGLIKIHSATNQKLKYDNLLDKIEKIGWIKRGNKTIKNLNIEIEPSILYIQPTNEESIDSVISFDDIIIALSDSNDPVTKRFIESLEKWKSDTNKKLKLR